MKYLFLFLFLFSLPGFGQEDEDKHIRELEAQRQKRMEMAVKLDQSRQQFQNSTLTAIEELKKLGHEEITAASFADEKVVKVMRRLLKNNPLRNFPRYKVKALILEKAKDSYLGTFLSDHPKVLDLFTDILIDTEALPSLMGIFLRKDDLKFYLYIWIGILILGFFIKRLFIPKEWVGWRKVLAGLSVSFLLTVLCLGIFYNMFSDEVGPLLGVVSKHL